MNVDSFHVAMPAALLPLAGAKCSMITSHGGSTFHFYLYTVRASSKSTSSCASEASATTCKIYITLLKLKAEGNIYQHSYITVGPTWFVGGSFL